MPSAIPALPAKKDENSLYSKDSYITVDEYQRTTLVISFSCSVEFLCRFVTGTPVVGTQIPLYDTATRDEALSQPCFESR